MKGLETKHMNTDRFGYQNIWISHMFLIYFPCISHKYILYVNSLYIDLYLVYLCILICKFVIVLIVNITITIGNMDLTHRYDMNIDLTYRMMNIEIR